ncbi:MAG: Holliday junction resolvase RuvX [Thermoanaerobaculia bacterium]
MSLLGIDFGARRIGVAVSASGFLATPHSVIDNRGDLEGVLEEIRRLAEELDAERIVLGIPRRERKDQALEEKFAALAEAIRQKTGVDVVLWDEAYSTTEADSRRRERGERRNRRKMSIDMEAAAVILQAYLDQNGRAS